MVTTPKLGVRLMASNDVQKEVVFNEAAVVFDAMVARSAINRQNNPPSSPADGATYIVNVGATGVWSGHDNKIALWFNGWRFYSPLQKMKFFNETTSTFWTYSGTGWTEDPAGTPSTLDDLTNVGISDPQDGDVLTFNAGENRWEAQAPAAIPTLQELADVNVTTLLDGQILAWSESASEWVNIAPPVGGGGGATRLDELEDVEMNSPDNGDILTWDSTTNKAMFKPYEFPATELNDLNDVNVGGAQANDVLAFNGAAWGPSPAVITYSFLGMVDGPGTFEGFANHFLVVDSAESEMVFKSFDDLFSASDFKVQDMADMLTPTDAAVGMLVRLRKDGSAYSYDYVAATDYSIPAYANEAQITTRIRSLTFQGFEVTEGGDGHLTLTAQNALEFQADGDPFEGEISAINFIGSGVNVTLIEGVVTVDIGDQELVAALADLQDVDLETTPPVDGDVLKFDAASQKWIPGVGTGGGGNPIEDGEYAPATYEFGPFAPPRANMFPGRHNSPSADLTEVATRGLVVQPGPQSSGVRHAVVYRQLAFDEEPWVVTARIVPQSFSVAGHMGGIVLQRGFNGAFVFLALGNSNSDTQFQLRLGWVSAAGAETLLLTEPNLYNWLRLGFDGNTIRAWVSSDGLVWQAFGNAVDPSTTLQGVPDRVGITNRSNATHDGTCGTLVTYWEDPDFPASPRIQQGVVALGMAALQDVDLETVPPVDGQTLVWSEDDLKWVPGEAGGVIEGLGDIGDVDLETVPPEEGQALIWDGTNWVPGPASPETLGDIGDVDLDDLEDGQALVWDADANKWVAGAAGAAYFGEWEPSGLYLDWENAEAVSEFEWTLGSPTIASNADASAGLTKALKMPTITNNQNTVGSLDFTAHDLGGDPNFVIRYRVSSENGYDFFDVLIDDVQVVHTSGDGSWSEYSNTLDPGEHNLKIRYSKDGSQNHFDDTAYVSKLTIPAANPVVYPQGAIVSHAAKKWICLVGGTVQEPGVGEDWEPLSSGGALSELTDVDLEVAPVDGNSLVWDGTAGRWVPGAGFGNVATEFDISLFITGTPDAEAVIARYITAREYTLAADLDESFAYAETPPDANVTLTIRKTSSGVGTDIGTIEFLFGENAGAFTFEEAVSFVPGDSLSVVSPVSLQNLADISITFAGSRI